MFPDCTQHQRYMLVGQTYQFKFPPLVEKMLCQTGQIAHVNRVMFDGG